MLEYNILGIQLLEWIGYAASVLVLISLTMTSIVKLRWYNLTGAVLFSAYGFLIGSLPVGIMNFLIVCANLYNLQKMYKRKEDFKIIEIKENDELLTHFLDFYKKDIKSFFPDYKMGKGQLGMFVLRDMAVAGIFIGSKDQTELRIELDYALPQYRDFKVGAYLYNQLSDILQKHDINSVYFDTGMNLKYMEKMGFEASDKDGNSIMQKSLKKSS
ncbi:hypothetical protein GQR60_09275 [Labilibaculum sp. A4]|uniref:N-acetyltransferase domain-containing protein n=1 Tax=Labilibaculum euxinus TaxID=2686357 RepID=A0A425YBF5_9BACT|nr:YgjV family protein [Labilibaculum euxinus]MDQ1771582.1 YgjV family protein [Labilibaculum euxinus]MUP38238.1 hypothetical protein [Labilibaculum euxinus]MVB07443.1 hypothetical protein [Labilibaculum euxinus]MWN76529.1 hypothetical protein [Labilibaculum euxinus]